MPIAGTKCFKFPAFCHFWQQCQSLQTIANMFVLVCLVVYKLSQIRWHYCFCLHPIGEGHGQYCSDRIFSLRSSGSGDFVCVLHSPTPQGPGQSCQSQVTEPQELTLRIHWHHSQLRNTNKASLKILRSCPMHKWLLSFEWWLRGYVQKQYTFC